MKSISFLMPTPVRGGAVGGYKVVYEYANRLINDGYDITIVYPLTSDFKRSPFNQTKKLVSNVLYWILKGITGRKWFPLNTKIKEKIVLSLNWRVVPKSDIYFATAVETSYYLSEYPLPNSSKFYLIQDYENWGHSIEYVNSSYNLGLNNLTISKWLTDKVNNAGAQSILIKNGFDFDFFKLSTPVYARDRFTISMMYHNDQRKGCVYGLEALMSVKKQYPDLKVNLFGVPQRPIDLPEWIEYFQSPNKEQFNKIYNNSYIYLAPSLQEGWGLTVGEAMICGAAIVCTDTLGFQEMVKQNQNGIIVPTKDSKALAKAMIFLIENKEFHDKIAHQGHSDIQKFTWNESYEALKRVIEHPETDGE